MGVCSVVNACCAEVLRVDRSVRRALGCGQCCETHAKADDGLPAAESGAWWCDCTYDRPSRGVSAQGGNVVP